MEPQMNSHLTGIHEFSINDYKGTPHKYVLTAHDPDDGMEIMFALMGLGAGPVLSLVGAALKTENAASEIAKAFTDDAENRSVADQIRSLVSGVDFATIAPELQRFLTGPLPSKLVRKILARTHRDGKSLGSDEGFNNSYRGNYMEMLTATWRVISINRFFPQLSTSQTSS